MQPAEVVVRRAGAFWGDHARPDRRLRRTRRAEHLALPRLNHTLEHLSALACLRIGDADTRHIEPELRVEFGVVVVNLEGTLRNESQSAPFEVWPQFECLGPQ